MFARLISKEGEVLAELAVPEGKEWADVIVFDLRMYVLRTPRMTLVSDPVGTYVEARMWSAPGTLRKARERRS